MGNGFTTAQIIDWAYAGSPVLTLMGNTKRCAWDNSGTRQLALACLNAGERHAEIINNLPFLLAVDEWIETFTRYKNAHKKKNLGKKRKYLKILESIEAEILKIIPPSPLGILCKLLIWNEKKESQDLFIDSLNCEDNILSFIMRDLMNICDITLSEKRDEYSKSKVMLDGHFLTKMNIEFIKKKQRSDDIHPFLFDIKSYDRRMRNIE